MMRPVLLAALNCAAVSLEPPTWLHEHGAPEIEIHRSMQEVPHVSSASGHSHRRLLISRPTSRTFLSWKGVAARDAVALDEDPNVRAIECTPGSLAITVKDVSKVRWVAGQVLSGGLSWGCYWDSEWKRSATPQPFFHRALEYNNEGHVVHVRTRQASFVEAVPSFEMWLEQEHLDGIAHQVPKGAELLVRRPRGPVPSA